MHYCISAHKRSSLQKCPMEGLFLTEYKSSQNVSPKLYNNNMIAD